MPLHRHKKKTGRRLRSVLLTRVGDGPLQPYIDAVEVDRANCAVAATAWFNALQAKQAANDAKAQALKAYGTAAGGTDQNAIAAAAKTLLTKTATYQDAVKNEKAAVATYKAAKAQLKTDEATLLKQIQAYIGNP